MKKLLFVLLGVSALAISSCDWWDPYPVDPWDPVDPPSDTTDPWNPRDTCDNGDGIGDTIIFDDPWGPGDSNWWDPRDTN